MLVLAVAVGFLGPFGTYLNDPFVDRVRVWCLLLAGAYLLVRPLIFIFDRLAAVSSLPARPLRFWGAVVASVPIAAVWSSIGEDTVRAEGGYLLLGSFALLGGLAVFAVTEWARWADRRLPAQPRATAASVVPPDDISPSESTVRDGAEGSALPVSDPPLLARLSPAFHPPIVALQSEDHYVRVHGRAGSELLLMRLRDAIAEMGQVRGERVHRSWWVAQSAVAGVERSGRAWALQIAGGRRAPVARESVRRLQSSGFLSDVTGEEATSQPDRER